MPRKMKFNHIACVHCGTQNKIELPQDASPQLRPCTKCGRHNVDPFALLLALRLYSDDGVDCRSCKVINSIHHKYCFACGIKLKAK